MICWPWAVIFLKQSVVFSRDAERRILSELKILVVEAE